MSIDEKLLQILCCPETKAPVTKLTQEKLDKLNEHISKKEVKYKDNSLVESLIEEGLITEDLKTIYIIEDNIPIMITDKGISTEQVPGVKI